MCGVALTGAPGYVDEGALCREEGSIITYAKKSYGRGAGQLLQCGDDKVEDAALCYPVRRLCVFAFFRRAAPWHPAAAGSLWLRRVGFPSSTRLHCVVEPVAGNVWV